jgi:hypothetical protein
VNERLDRVAVVTVESKPRSNPHKPLVVLHKETPGVPLKVTTPA